MCALSVATTGCRQRIFDPEPVTEVANAGVVNSTANLPDGTVVELDNLSHSFYSGEYKNSLTLTYGQFYFSVTPPKGDTFRLFRNGIEFKVPVSAEFNIKIDNARNRLRLTVYKGAVIALSRGAADFWMLTDDHSIQVDSTVIKHSRFYVQDSAWRHMPHADRTTDDFE